MFFYREVQSPVSLTLTDSFEFSEGWPDTIADVNYYLTYSFSATNSQQDSFEISEGW